MRAATRTGVQGGAGPRLRSERRVKITKSVTQGGVCVTRVGIELRSASRMVGAVRGIFSAGAGCVWVGIETRAGCVSPSWRIEKRVMRTSSVRREGVSASSAGSGFPSVLKMAGIALGALIAEAGGVWERVGIRAGFAGPGSPWGETALKTSNANRESVSVGSVRS